MPKNKKSWKTLVFSYYVPFEKFLNEYPKLAPTAKVYESNPDTGTERYAILHTDLSLAELKKMMDKLEKQNPLSCS